MTSSVAEAFKFPPAAAHINAIYEYIDVQKSLCMQKLKNNQGVIIQELAQNAQLKTTHKLVSKYFSNLAATEEGNYGERASCKNNFFS